jgi:ribosome-associated protein
MKNPALKTALEAIDDKKGLDVLVLDIAEIASFTSYFVLCTGESSRQIQAIADEVELRLREKHGTRPAHVEGYRNAEWVLMDYEELVVHVFSKKARAFYDLERLWRDGKRLDPKKLTELRAAGPAARTPRRGRTKTPSEGPAEDVG